MMRNFSLSAISIFALSGEVAAVTHTSSVAVKSQPTKCLGVNGWRVGDINTLSWTPSTSHGKLIGPPVWFHQTDPDELPFIVLQKNNVRFKTQFTVEKYRLNPYTYVGTDYRIEEVTLVTFSTGNKKAQFAFFVTTADKSQINVRFTEVYSDSGCLLY